MENIVTFEIIEEVSIISEGSKGLQTELNIVKRGDNEPKYDIRPWSPNHEKMGKGITMTAEELGSLKQILDKLDK